MPAKPKPKDPKTAPGLVTIRLQVTPDNRDKLRVIAAEDKTDMANWSRSLVEAEIKRRKP